MARTHNAQRCRAGADEVVAVERARQLCQISELTTALAAANVCVVQKDARFLSVGGGAGAAGESLQQAGAISCDLAGPVQAVVFEVS